MVAEVEGKRGENKMDEKRVRILLRDLRTTGRLFNSVGSQYWTDEEKEEKYIKW